MSETVDHSPHYGGAGNPYEAIRVIEAWSLGFCLGNAVKYIARAGKKALPGSTKLEDEEALAKQLTVEDLRKAMWYLDREVQRLTGDEHLRRAGHLCECGHTPGAHSDRRECQLCACFGFAAKRFE